MPNARNTDPFTSHEAAASVVGLRPKQLAVLDCLKLYGPTNDPQLLTLYRTHAEAHGWPEQSDSGLRTRRSELVEKGLIYPVDTSTLPSGRRALVWGIRLSDSQKPVPESGAAVRPGPSHSHGPPPTPLSQGSLIPDPEFDPWALDLA